MPLVDLLAGLTEDSVVTTAGADAIIPAAVSVVCFRCDCCCAPLPLPLPLPVLLLVLLLS